MASGLRPSKFFARHSGFFVETISSALFGAALKMLTINRGQIPIMDKRFFAQAAQPCSNVSAGIAWTLYFGEPIVA
ncbi:hypothetical protein CEQ24_011455 [Burkholderia glumae]|nr:hypothetical protein NCPPB3923_25425 [Burkholderia glumae]PNL06402.1 hypothetical protein CEQ24_011455 [Burkholderia glumae]